MDTVSPDCQKSFAEFSAQAENKVKKVFDRGMYVGENTSQAASVEFVRPPQRGPHKAECALWGEEKSENRWNILQRIWNVVF